MRKLKPLLFMLMPLALTIAMPAAGQGIGYVDARRLIEQAPQGRVILRELQSEFAERANALQTKAEAFQTRRADFQNQRESLSQDELQAKASELGEIGRQLQREQAAYQEDYARRRDQRIAELEKDITAVIVEVAKREKLDIVFQQAVYTSPDIDLTERVLDELKKRHQ